MLKKSQVAQQIRLLARQFAGKIKDHEDREFKRGEESLMASEVKKHGILVR